MKALLFTVSVLLLAGLLVLAGCSGGGSNATRVRLLVADAPLHLQEGTEVTAVNVAISRVELLPTEDESMATTLFEGSETINLISLANKPLAQLPQLGVATIPAGTYTQLRLIVDEANSNVVTTAGTFPLKVASGPQTGLKVVDLNLSIAAGVTQALLLDFDLSKLHENNEFKLTPNAIRVAELDEAGSVTGKLALPAATQTTEDVVATLTIHPALGDAVAITQVVLNTAAPEATFTFNGIPAGSDYVVSVNLTYGAQTATFDIPGVTVTTGATTDLGTTVISGLTFTPAP